MEEEYCPYQSVINRIQSCETTFELLERYSSVSQANHTWIDESMKKLPLENGVDAAVKTLSDQ